MLVAKMRALFMLLLGTQLYHNVRGSEKVLFTNITKKNNISSLSSNSLFIKWSKPTRLLGTTNEYLVKCKFIAKIDCKMDNIVENVFSKNINATEIEINNLQSYSKYEISVYAKKGQALVSKMYRFTEPSSLFSLQTFTCTIIMKERTLDVLFNVNCSDWNGPVNAYVKATCKSEWCDGKTQEIIKQFVYHNMIITVDNLLPYTNYTLDVYLHPNRKELVNESNMLKTVDVITLPCVLNSIPFAEVYSINNTSLSIRWTVPYPPTGMLEDFLIEAQYKNYFNQWKHYSPRRYIINKTACTVWTNMFCATITGLYKNYNYLIQISGKNQYTAYGKPFSLTEKTSIKEPNPPLNLHGTWESNILILNWQHPNKTNGPLSNFTVNINSGNPMVYKVYKENLTYTFKTSFECTTSDHGATVSLKTHNSLYASKAVYNSFKCPVFMPVFLSTPELRSVRNNTLVIYIPSLQNTESDSALYVLEFTNQQDLKDNCSLSLNETMISSLQTATNKVCSIIKIYTAINYNVIENSEQSLNSNSINFEENVYALGILLVNKYERETKHNWYQLMSKLERNENSANITNSFNFWWLIFVALLHVIVVGAVYSWMWKAKPTKEPDVIYEEIQILTRKPLEPSVPFIPPPLPNRLVPELHPPKQLATCTQMVTLDKFTEYVKDLIDDGNLVKQYERILRSTEEANNCYRPQGASDCLDASYISSPLCKNAYVMCGTPTFETQYNFWKTILDEQIENIILLARTTDIEKKKLVPYWPEVQVSKMLCFQDIKVSSQSVNTLANYKVHRLQISRGEQILNLQLLHFTSWAKRGTSMQPNALVPFLASIQSIPHSSKHPILVHEADPQEGCASLIVLADICLRQANLDGQVDICNQLQRIRTQRLGVMNTPSDYLLLHIVLVKCLTSSEYTYSCEIFAKVHPTINEAQLNRQMEIIMKNMWIDRVLISEGPVIFHNESDKDRDRSILPNPSHCVFLRPPKEETSSYINAIFVDGYNQLKMFIATQHPLENTVDDFWQMVVDNNVKLVISLQPDYDVEFWRRNSDLRTKNGTFVEHINITEFEELHIHSVDVTLSGFPGSRKEIKLMEVFNCNLKELVPSDLGILLTTRQQLKNMKWKEFSSVVIMCRNGADATGLFIAMCNLLDCIESEHVIDVCAAVRNIRCFRRQFVTQLSQLRALYDVAAMFMNNFKSYSNFGTLEDCKSEEEL